MDMKGKTYLTISLVLEAAIDQNVNDARVQIAAVSACNSISGLT